MAKKTAPKRRQKLTLAPLTPEQAMRGLLKVKPSDMKEVESQDKAKKR